MFFIADFLKALFNCKQEYILVQPIRISKNQTLLPGSIHSRLLLKSDRQTTFTDLYIKTLSPFLFT